MINQYSLLIYTKKFSVFSQNSTLSVEKYKKEKCIW
ncbi:hypothetical protein [Enterococcus phage vB_Efs30_KEN14]